MSGAQFGRSREAVEVSMREDSRASGRGQAELRRKARALDAAAVVRRKLGDLSGSQRLAREALAAFKSAERLKEQDGDHPAFEKGSE